jgi:hypothetical protein
VVTVNPEASEDAVQQEHLWWRDSMRKFKSDHYVLEVLSYSKYLPGHLNQQIIAVMGTHGVPDEAFLSLQSEQVSFLSLHVNVLVACGVGLNKFVAIRSLHSTQW